MEKASGGGGGGGAGGTGLSLDGSDTANFLSGKSFLSPRSNTTFGSLKRKHAMDSNHQQRFDLPITLINSRGSGASDHVSPAPHPSDSVDGKRMDVSEMDFFSAEKKTDLNLKAPPLTIKKEDDNVNTGLHLLTASDQSSMVDDGLSPDEDEKQAKNELVAMQAELGRLNEENQRLRGMLSQVTTNYNALYVHLVTLIQQRSQRNGGPQAIHDKPEDPRKHDKGGPILPRQFMDLGSAATAENEEPSHSSTDGGSQERRSSTAPNGVEVASMEYHLHNRSGNKEIVTLDQHNERSSTNDDGRCSLREESPDPASNGWGKVSKMPNPKSSDPAQEATMRKARVSVRARSEAPMITDGCQWRKYGQKMAKGNPCPRAYYRCTMATACPVRKQVQRCAEDRTILITTYEGSHNHPLPPAAMAMASTTSAAASMLLSGSMSSTDGLMNSNFLARTILPCSSSMATISASAPFPTVTLDLTQTPNPMQFQRPPQSQFQIPFPGGAPAPPQQPNSLALGQTLYNQSKFSGLQLSSADGEGSQFTSHHPKQQPPTLADSVSAATAAITADPNFTAALAAAITSIIGGASPPTTQPNNEQHQ